MDDDPTNDYLADAVTDDLTTDLSRIAGAWVIARESAYTYKGKATDVRQIGRELGVRYVLEGSVRKIGAILRVNVQLISAETGAHLWSDRFDEEIRQLAAGQQQIIERMYDTIGLSLVEIESARSQRERPTNPDAFDLILRARSMRQLPPTPERDKEMLALYERALLLDPRSVYCHGHGRLFPDRLRRTAGAVPRTCDAPDGCWSRRAPLSRSRHWSSTTRSSGCERWVAVPR